MATNPQYQIKKRFNQVRKKMGKTQVEFAALTGLSQVQISQIETGARLVSESVYFTLFETISVNRKWLELGEGPMFAEKPAKLLSGDPSTPQLTTSGERLQYLRLKEQLTLKEIADKLSVNDVRVMRYEKGTSPLSTKFITAVCETFSVNLNWLLTGEGEMYGKPEKKNLVSDLNTLNVQMATQGKLLHSLQKTVMALLVDNKTLRQELNELKIKIKDSKKQTY